MERKRGKNLLIDVEVINNGYVLPYNDTNFLELRHLTRLESPAVLKLGFIELFGF